MVYEEKTFIVYERADDCLSVRPFISIPKFLTTTDFFERDWPSTEIDTKCKMFLSIFEQLVVILQQVNRDFSTQLL
jgi:hypothetical protein